MGRNTISSKTSHPSGPPEEDSPPTSSATPTSAMKTMMTPRPENSEAGIAPGTPEKKELKKKKRKVKPSKKSLSGKMQDEALDLHTYQRQIERLERLWKKKEAQQEQPSLPQEAENEPPPCWMGYFRSNMTLESDMRQLRLNLCYDNGVLEGINIPLSGGNEPAGSYIGRWYPHLHSKKTKSTLIDVVWLQIDSDSIAIAVGKIHIYDNGSKSLSGDYAVFGDTGASSSLLNLNTPADQEVKDRGFFSFQAEAIDEDGCSQGPSLLGYDTKSRFIVDPELGSAATAATSSGHQGVRDTTPAPTSQIPPTTNRSAITFQLFKACFTSELGPLCTCFIVAVITLLVLSVLPSPSDDDFGDDNFGDP